MLHLFVGIDTAAAKAKARAEAKGELVLCGDGGQPFEAAPTYAASQGLFAPTVTLVLDRPFESAEGKALVEAHGDLLHDSDVQVYVIEVSLTAEQKKVFPKSVKVTDFGKAEKAERLLPFALSDAFMGGNRKVAWIEYQKLLMQGTTPEEVHGTLSWAVRSALLAAKTKSATEAGLKPFVYSKSKQIAAKMGLPALESLSRRLVALYHRARMGHGDLALSLETLILEKP